MRAAVCLALVTVGCSSLLGIQDPSAGTVDGGNIDAPDGGGGSDTLLLSLGTAKLAQQQVVPLRVQRMPASGAAVDVTADATYVADKANIVDLTTKGKIIGATAGSVTITVTAPGAQAATLTATVSTFTCHPVINEFTTGAPATSGGADNEFIEVFNPCAAAVTVAGWTLNYRAATATTGADSHELATLATQMMPGEFRVYAGQTYPGAALFRWPTGFGMGQMAGALALRNGPSDTGVGDEGDIVDAVAYGTTVGATHPFIETKALGDMANEKSASRLPFDGRDDAAAGSADGDNSIDFKIVATPTPGAANKP